MVKYLTFSNIKVVIVGFFIGMLCSLILTSTMNWYHPPLLKLKPFHDEHSGHHEGETILVDQLARKTPVMAFIFTSEKGLANRASHVKSTWADRFNEAVFFSDREDPAFPTVALPPAKGWAYTRSAITYIYENHGKKFDFFMKVEDKNYVIVENLREILKTMDSARPLLIGRRMKAKDDSTYVSEDAGYAISRAGLEKLAAAIKGDIEACKMSDFPTEQVFGKCAEAAGLELIHAVDEKGLDVFHPFSPKDFFKKFVKEKYPDQTVYQPSQMNEDRNKLVGRSKLLDLQKRRENEPCKSRFCKVRQFGLGEDENATIGEMPRYSQQTRLLFFGIFVGICFFILIRFIDNPNSDGNVVARNLDKTSSINDNSKSAKEQEIQVRIFAIVITSPAEKYKKAVHVKSTWAKRADVNSTAMLNKLNIFAGATDKEGRSVLWEKTRKGFMHIYYNHLNKYDFFLKTDDDTYVIVENLKFLLSFLNASKPFIMGRKLKVSVYTTVNYF
ncbi:unnamed protein product [Rodentolepis nana]|uniref:N-acetylgalactosaminide beta-1,3-galactosyltransferase n=1 Tax=Rodentolepis nana TaxID=102285 RepID=A0A0R3TQI7_RODNA|nr:unnamed protein product [Rodentolepis nana]